MSFPECMAETIVQIMSRSLRIHGSGMLLRVWEVADQLPPREKRSLNQDLFLSFCQKISIALLGENSQKK